MSQRDLTSTNSVSRLYLSIGSHADISIPMKSFPFVLGTDIVHLIRWDPIRRPRVILGLARRTLHPKEYHNITKVSPTLYDALMHQGPFEQFDTKGRTKTGSDWELEAGLFKDQLNHTSAGRIRNFLAGRWAAKEAARKAWGAHLLGFKDVRVTADLTQSGDPNVRDHGGGSPGVRIVCEPYWGPLNLKKAVIKLDRQQEGRLSISHDGDYVVATVIAEPLNEDLRSLFEGRKASNIPLGQTHTSSKEKASDDTD